MRTRHHPAYLASRLTPYPGYDALDGLDERDTLSRDNPLFAEEYQPVCTDTNPSWLKPLVLAGIFAVPVMAVVSAVLS